MCDISTSVKSEVLKLLFWSEQGSLSADRMCRQSVIYVGFVFCQQNSPGKSTNDCEQTKEGPSNNRLGIYLTLPVYLCL